MYQTVIFDLDGTLLNTIDDLADAGNWVCAQNGWPTHTVAEFKQMVGHGIPNLVERFSPENQRDAETLAGTLAQFSARYAAHKQDKTAPYPGMPALVERLARKGILTAVFSNKADDLTQAIIGQYFGGTIAFVRGSRPGVPTKPDPTGLFSLMEQMGVTAEGTLFVGDSNVDIQTAQNAHLVSAGVLWGFRDEAELAAAGADHIVATADALEALILG